MNYDDEKTIIGEDINEVQTSNKKKGFQLSDRGRKVAVGAGIGIALGASTAAVASTLIHNGEENAEAENAAEGEAQVEVAENVNDNMSFTDAFNAAREEVGPGGVFHWHGQAYSTYTADEWDGMSPEERAAYGERVSSEVQSDDNHVAQNQQSHSNAGQAHQQAEQHVEQPAQDHQQDNHGNEQAYQQHDNHNGNDEDVVVVDGGGGEQVDPDVRIIGVEDVTLDDGSVATIGAASVNGHDVVLVDIDHDGTFDVGAIDANNNGQIEDHERFDVSEDHITVSSFRDAAEANAGVEYANSDHQVGEPEPVVDDNSGFVQTDEGLADDMPDYANDVDGLA
ncbi:MAG: hypothetical protein IJ710_08605 [Prevotella sp.]|nr:hypothetical protein [Prevotella sp.]